MSRLSVCLALVVVTLVAAAQAHPHGHAAGHAAHPGSKGESVVIRANGSTRRIIRPDTTEFTFHLGTCVGNMTFIGCHDMVGTWVTPPTDIPNNAGISFTVALPESGDSVGNCTWTYHNKHGKWLAYWNWEVQILGNQDFGMGCADSIDNVDTSMTAPLPIFNVVCGVFGYGVDGVNYCIAQTSPTSDGCDGWSSVERVGH